MSRGIGRLPHLFPGALIRLLAVAPAEQTGTRRTWPSVTWSALISNTVQHALVYSNHRWRVLIQMCCVESRCLSELPNITAQRDGLFARPLWIEASASVAQIVTSAIPQDRPAPQ